MRKIIIVCSAFSANIQPLTVIGCFLLFSSCLFQSQEPIKELNSPNSEMLKEFDLPVSESLVFQFYEEYGFNDIVKRMILIEENYQGKLGPKVICNEMLFLRPEDDIIPDLTLDIVLNLVMSVHHDIRIKGTRYQSGKFDGSILVDQDCTCDSSEEGGVQTNRMYFPKSKLIMIVKSIHTD